MSARSCLARESRPAELLRLSASVDRLSAHVLGEANEVALEQCHLSSIHMRR